MFEAIVEKILNRILHEYVEGFNSENLKIGLWSGQVVIKNVTLKKNIIKKLNLPLNIKYSKLGCLRMNIPWSSLASSKIDVVVEGLEILITETPQKDWQCKNDQIIQKRIKEIDEYCNTIVKDFAEKASKSGKQQEEEGYLSKLVVKIIDNIQVTIKDIHIRYEDQITNKYSFGVTLEELKIYTVNAKGEAQFIDRTKKQYQNEPLRKNLILSNLGIYWNEKTIFFPSDKLHQYMFESIARKNQAINHPVNHVILMSFDAKLYRRQAGKQFDKPQIELQIGFETLKLEISNEQLQQIVILSERLQKYTNQVKAQNRKKLSQLEMISNRQLFLELFPKYYDKTLSKKQMQHFRSIIQKMEISIFSEGIKKYLQTKEKQRMMNDKKQKSKGWFSGPKELTENEIQEIQKFVVDNFDAPVITVKRPPQFYYIQVNFVLKKLQIVIANNNFHQGTKDGIRAIFSSIKTEFNLREGGHLLNFGIENFKVQLFNKRMNTLHENTTTIIQKLSEELKLLKKTQYISLTVIGSPLEKKHLDTEIILRTQELLILFDPRMIKIAQDFANIKVSSQNTEAAFEAYGEIKKQTTSLASESFETHQKKNFLSIDAKISAMNLILFFDPQDLQKDIWAISLGNIDIFTDQQTLLKPEFKYNEPMQKYAMTFKDISMVHHENRRKFLASKIDRSVIKNNSILLNDLNVDFALEIYQKPTNTVPKIKGIAIMHTVELGISELTYKSIQKIGNCFTLPSTEAQENKGRAQQKKEVIKGAKKIGILWEHGKQVKKYVAVLNGGYLYLFKDKNDQKYTKYYFTKNSTFEVVEKTTVEKKSYAVIVENSIDKFQLGFQKKQIMQIWIKTMKTYGQENYQIIEEKEKEMKVQKKTDPNTLNFEVYAKIQKIAINTIVSSQKYIKINIMELGSKVFLHQEKIKLNISLKEIQLRDNLYSYKYRQLNNFLYSESFEGSGKLIDIKINQFSEKHPEYNYVDNQIEVNFGKLICNYKPETVETVMLFFLPKNEGPPKQLKEKKSVQNTEENQVDPDEIKKKKALDIIGEILNKKPERYTMKINVTIQEVAVSLINRKNKVMFGKLGLTGFNLLFGQSSRKMILSGGLEEMWFIDYSNYPYTIIQEQSEYDKVEHLLESKRRENNMMEFDIKILEVPNTEGKNMLIYTKINDLKVSYVQQPVLRILTYLTEQMLPSLTPQDKGSGPKPVIVNDSRPSKGTMKLETVLENIVVYIEPRTKTQVRDFLQVCVKHITVQNSGIYRPFIEGSSPINKNECVLVENYTVKMKGINLTEMIQNKETKLTNDIDFIVSCDLIQNPLYYHKTFGSKFKGGMRIDCHMAPFLMKMNHDDYNFIMKCLFWCISYDDNAEGYMFDGAPQQTNEKGQVQTQKSDPMYFVLIMDKIALCVTQNNLPISVINLNIIDYKLTMQETGMFMDMTMKNIFGTNIHQTSDPKISKQLGLFNAFGHQKMLNTEELYDIDSLVKLVSRNDMVYKDKGAPVINFYMEMLKNGNMLIDLRIEALNISIELRNLLIMSKLALMQASIQPPKPQLQPKNKPAVAAPPAGKMKIDFYMGNFLGSLSDQKNENFVVMEGQIAAKMTNHPRKPDNQVLELASKYQEGYTMNLAQNVFQVHKFSFYFCNIRKMKNKRFILQPMNLNIMMKQYFEKQGIDVLNNTQINGSIDKIIVESSIRDLIKISAIAQDNLAKLSQSNGAPKQDQKKKDEQKEEQISNLTKQKVADKETVTKAIKAVQNKLIPKTKANILLEPMMVRIVNDCDNNFMPVINFILQESTILFRADAIKSHFSQQDITIKMDFFNPRSSDWEPVIESFRLSFDYLALVHQFGQQSKMIISSSEVKQLSEIKINVSTQFIKSLTATMDIASIQQKKLTKQTQVVDEFEVSPFIIQNLTYTQIIIHRIINKQQNSYPIKPLFRGPVRLSQNAQKIEFTLHKLRYSIPLDKYGVNRIQGKPDFYMDFTVDQLNRVIKFVNGALIKNNTKITFYCLRYDSIPKQLDKEPVAIEPGQLLPIRMDGYIQLSINSRTYTHLTSVRDLRLKGQIFAQSGKFKLSFTHRQTTLKHSIFTLRPPLIISNCLPKDIKFQYIKGGKTATTNQIKALSDRQFFANQDLSEIRFKIKVDGFYWTQEFGINENKYGEEQQLLMSDRKEGGTSIKFIMQKKQSQNMFNFKIYCSGYIISELDYDVQIFGNLMKDELEKSIQKYELLGGQSEYWKQTKMLNKEDKTLDKITFIGAETGNKLRICGKGCLIDFSQPLLISGLGVNQSRIVVEKEVNGKKIHLFTTIGAQIKLKQMGKNSQIYSKEVVLRSRSIIINETNYDFDIKEQGSEKYLFSINKKDKRPFHFTMPQLKEKPKGLILRTPNTCTSFPIMSNGLGNVYFRLQRNDKKGSYIYFKLVIEEVKPYIFHIIHEVKQVDLPYQLVVKSQKFQVNIPYYERLMRKDSEPLYFINQKPDQGFEVFLQVRAVGAAHFEELHVEVDNLNFNKDFNYFEEDVTETFFAGKVCVLFNDNKKFIIINERYNEEQKTPEFMIQTINLKINKIFLSLISNHHELDICRPYESFVVSLFNLQFYSETTNKKTSYQTRLQFWQIDQNDPFNIPNPVIITPYKYKQFIEEKQTKKPKAVFNSLIEIDNSFVKNMLINRILVDIEDFVLHADTQFIKIILKVSKDFTQILNSEKEDNKLQKKTNVWQQKNIPIEGRKTFIKDLKIAPFTIEISAQLRLNQLDTESVIIFGTVINALGVVITNIQGAPIVFDGIQIEDCVDTADGLNKKLMQHYKSSVIRQLYKVFGSLNIIGNPVSLFRNVSTGFKDLKDKPSEGFVEGPLEFGKGLAEGTTSLIAHSIGGALNSVQKVTGTIASGLAVLTFDKQFEEMREKQKMKKPKHIFQGLQKGGKAVFNGFKEGITGVFTKPYENTKKEGVVGFFKGTAQGVAGLVVKPVTGVVDFASKTTQGLKNTALYLEDKPNENRIRYPRVFYTQLSNVREYDPIDSKLYAIINKTKYEDRYGFENTLFIESFVLSEQEFLLILMEDVIMIRIDSEKIEWAVPIQDCQIISDSKKVKVSAKNRREWYTRKVNQLIKFKDIKEQRKFQNLIIDLKQSMEDKRDKEREKQELQEL